MKDNETDLLTQAEIRFNNTLPMIREGWNTLTYEEQQHVCNLLEPYFGLENRSMAWLEGFLRAAVLYVAWAMSLNPSVESVLNSESLPGMVLGLGYVDKLITKKFMEEVN
jgi:hypothetical protein